MWQFYNWQRWHSFSTYTIFGIFYSFPSPYTQYDVIVIINLPLLCTHFANTPSPLLAYVLNESPQRWLPTGKVNANRNNGTVYIGCCTEGGGCEIATFTWFTMAWQALWLNTWPLGILILNCGWPMLSHIWILATPLFHRFQNTLGPIPQIPHYIVTYSTASIIDCDLFHCFDNWLGPIPQLPWLIGTYSTASIIDWDLFHSFNNWLGPIPMLQNWLGPIPQLQ